MLLRSGRILGRPAGTPPQIEGGDRSPGSPDIAMWDPTQGRWINRGEDVAAALENLQEHDQQLRHGSRGTPEGQPGHALGAMAPRDDLVVALYDGTVMVVDSAESTPVGGRGQDPLPLALGTLCMLMMKKGEKEYALRAP